MDSKCKWTLVPSWEMLAQVAHVSRIAVAYAWFGVYVMVIDEIALLDIWGMSM